MEAKIVACFKVETHAKCLNFIFGLKIVNSISKPLSIFFNNFFAISYVKSTKNIGRAIDFELKYFKLRVWIDNGDFEITYIFTNSMLIDPLTKGLKPIDSTKHVLKMDILSFFDILS